MMTQRQRAFTLIETLAAASLLSILAVTLLPLLRAPTPQERDLSPEMSQHAALVAFADRIAADPKLLEPFGGLPAPGAPTPIPLSLTHSDPGTSDHATINALVLLTREEDASFNPAASRDRSRPQRVFLARIRCALGDASVVRWVPQRSPRP